MTSVSLDGNSQGNDQALENPRKATIATRLIWIRQSVTTHRGDPGKRGILVTQDIVGQIIHRLSTSYRQLLHRIY